jgi:hypothetical protein
MLTCVYHPVYKPQVVESDEADSLKASGLWFDSPAKAKEYRTKLENEIKEESLIEESKKIQGKTKQRRKKS